MSSFEEKDDHYYIAGGHIGLSPTRLYALILLAISKTSYLKVEEGNQIPWLLRLSSERQADPRGIIEITIKPVGYAGKSSTFSIRVTDEEFLRTIRKGGQVARYGERCKPKDMLNGVLLQEVIEETREMSNETSFD